MPKKNDVFNAVITDVNNLGYGVCRCDGMVCFVKNAVTHDEAEIKVIKATKSYCIGKVNTFAKKSEYRTQNDCASYTRCGGCCFRHISYDYEKELKRNYIKQVFLKEGLEADVEEVYSDGNITSYRNKAQYPVSYDGRIGFFAEKSHELIENTACPLQDKDFEGIVGKLSDFMKKYGLHGYDEASGKGDVRHIYLRKGKKTGQIMVCLVVTKFPFRYSEQLGTLFENDKNVVSVMLNENSEQTNVITGKNYQTICGKSYIEDELGGVKLRISPASFYQVNHGMAEKLYEKAVSLAGSSECVTDLYCGIGSIGLAVAKKNPEIKLKGVEIVPEAVENASENARLNEIKNAKFICADSKDAENQILSETDTLILDPPRKGVDASLIEKIAKSGVKRIVYVSCSPETLARDVKIFTEKGYSFGKVYPFDLFPRTSHCENVLLITRKDKTDNQRN